MPFPCLSVESGLLAPPPLLPSPHPSPQALPFGDVQAEGPVVSICLGVPTAEALQYCAIVESVGYCIVIPSSTLSFPANYDTSMLMWHRVGPAYVTAVGMLSPSYRRAY